MSYISIQLSNEAVKIIVFEVVGKKLSGELRWVPDDEAIVSGTPGHNSVSRRIIDHIVCFGKKRRRTLRVQQWRWHRYRFGRVMGAHIAGIEGAGMIESGLGI